MWKSVMVSFINKINSPSGRGWIQPRPLDRSMLLLTSTGWAFDVISWLTHFTIILMNWKCRACYNYVVNLCLWRHNLKWCVNKFMTSWHEVKSISWRQKMRYDVKKRPWHQQVASSKTCVYVKNTLWRQKVCHDVKNASSV